MIFLSSGDGLGGSSARRVSGAGATRPRAPCVFAATAAAGAPTPAAGGGTAGALRPKTGGGAAGGPTSAAGWWGSNTARTLRVCGSRSSRRVSRTAHKNTAILVYYACVK